MKIENTEVYGFQSAIRAMRNPMDSWNKSDSGTFDISPHEINDKNINYEHFSLGDNDKKLSQTLTKAGTEHRKHLRMIQVWADFTLPRYIWSEMDTYKYINKNSCSTMHKLMSREITEEDFELDNIPFKLIDKINTYIQSYKESNSNEEKNNNLIACKNILPEGFLQKRTINTNYECLLSMYHQRKNHKLPQWHKICNWILELPYFTELTGIGEDK